VNKSEEIVEVGQFSSVYGVKGWIKVKSFTQPRTNIFNYKRWLIRVGNKWLPYSIENGRPHGKTIVVKLAEYNDRDQVQALVGSKIAIYRSELPETAENEYYWSDLLKMQVETMNGTVLGTVTEILETGSNDVLIVKNTQQSKAKECLIPWLEDDVIKEVNVVENKIIVDWNPDFIK